MPFAVKFQKVTSKGTKKSSPKAGNSKVLLKISEKCLADDDFPVLDARDSLNPHPVNAA